MKSAALSSSPLSTPASIQPSIRSSMPGSSASSSLLGTGTGPEDEQCDEARCHYPQPSHSSPAGAQAGRRCRDSPVHRRHAMPRREQCAAPPSEIPRRPIARASSTARRCSGSDGKSGGSGRNLSRKRAISRLVLTRWPSMSSDGTVPSRSIIRSMRWGRSSSRCRNAAGLLRKPRSGRRNGCNPVGSSTRS